VQILLSLNGCVSGEVENTPLLEAKQKVLNDDDPLSETNEVEPAADTLKSSADSAELLALPEFFERIDLDKFLRKRRTLFVKYLPLDKKFHEVNELFGVGSVLDREAEENLKSWVFEDERRAHWVFLQGWLIALEKLGDRERPMLREQQKSLIVQYTKSLGFIAACLDEKTKNVRYKNFVKRVYRTLASRYLYREVRDRSVPGKIETAPMDLEGMTE
jgi:hypothetical protein